MSPITNKTVAYKAGFSDSLSFNAQSAYSDATQYEFRDAGGKKRRLTMHYFSGYRAGLNLKKWAMKEFKISRSLAS